MLEQILALYEFFRVKGFSTGMKFVEFIVWFNLVDENITPRRSDADPLGDSASTLESLNFFLRKGEDADSSSKKSP